MRFDLVHHGPVGERGAVFTEIHGLRLGLQSGEFAPGVVVAFFEGLEGGGGAAFEAEGGGDAGPVDFCGGGALEGCC